MTAAITRPHSERVITALDLAAQDSAAEPLPVFGVDRRRLDAAEELARRLRVSACLPGTSAAPTVWPCDLSMLHWLRRMTYAGLYTWTAEENRARRWIGGDIFGIRRPADPPPFLADVDVRHVEAHLVAPLLRRLSMTRAAPSAADLTADALAAEVGEVSSYERDESARRWGQEDAPLLAETTVIPHVVHGVWLGRPLPVSNSFWHNYGAAADRYAGEVDFVLWTDISRARCDAARRLPQEQCDPVRDLLDWALRHGIHLVNVAEVFHASAPMTLHTPYTLELNQRRPQAFAAASDHLRVEVVHRFGGLYADGDLHLDGGGASAESLESNGYRLFQGRWTGAADVGGPAGLPELFDRVAASPPGFTLHALTDRIVLNDLIVAPAGHPALALWREGARNNYLREQRELFGDGDAVPHDEQQPGEPASWTWAVTPGRTGRVHHWLLAQLGFTATDLVKAAPAVGGHSELSWLPPLDGEPPVPCVVADSLPTLIGCIDLLRWRHLSRSGDLSLTSVAPLVRGLPDPDIAWIALLLVFADLSVDLGPVVSVTDQRRNQDGTCDAVTLPAEAEALLDRSATAAESWFLGERTVAVRLRAAEEAAGELRTPTQAW